MTRDIRRQMRALVEAVIAGREDADILRPVVKAYVETAVRDFERYFDSRQASARIRDFDILMARQKMAQRQRDNGAKVT